MELEENKLKERERNVIDIKRDIEILESKNEYLEMLDTDNDLKLNDF